MIAVVVNHSITEAIDGKYTSESLSILNKAKVMRIEVNAGFVNALKRDSVGFKSSFEQLYQIMSAEGIPSCISHSLMFKRSNYGLPANLSLTMSNSSIVCITHS